MNPDLPRDLGRAGSSAFSFGDLGVAAFLFDLVAGTEAVAAGVLCKVLAVVAGVARPEWVRRRLPRGF